MHINQMGVQFIDVDVNAFKQKVLPRSRDRCYRKIRRSVDFL